MIIQMAIKNQRFRLNSKGRLIGMRTEVGGRRYDVGGMRYEV